MSNKKEYAVISDSDITKFVAKVNAELGKGWELAGGLAVQATHITSSVAGAYHKPLFLQALQK